MFFLFRCCRRGVGAGGVGLVEDGVGIEAAIGIFGDVAFGNEPAEGLHELKHEGVFEVIGRRGRGRRRLGGGLRFRCGAGGSGVGMGCVFVFVFVGGVGGLVFGRGCFR